MPRIHCGDKPLPPGRVVGTPRQCFVLGITVSRQERKPRSGLRSIPGVGVKFEERLQQEYGILDTEAFIDKVRRIRGKKRRKDFLKKVFRGFENQRKVVRRSFDLARSYLEQNGVTVQPMS